MTDRALWSRRVSLLAAGLAALAAFVAPSTSQGAALYVKERPRSKSVELQSHDHRLLGLRFAMMVSCQNEGGPARRELNYFTLDPRRVVRVDRKGRFRIVRHYDRYGYKINKVVEGDLHRGFAELRYRSHTHSPEVPKRFQKAQECWTGHKREGEFVDSVARRRSAGAFYIQRSRNKRIWMWAKNGEIHHATILVRETCRTSPGKPTWSRLWATFPVPEKLPIRTRHRRFGWSAYADYTYLVDSWILGGRVRKRWITGKLSHTSYTHASDENYIFDQECGTGRGYHSPEATFAARRS